MEMKYITGILAPYGADNKITISQGRGGESQYAVPPEGLDFENTELVGCTDNTTGNIQQNGYRITIKLKNGMFLLSLRLYDLISGNRIVEINDNAYSITDADVNDYYPNKNFFNDSHAIEIIDKHDLVVFSMWVDDKNVVQVRGYFVGPICTVVFNGGLMEYFYLNQVDYRQKPEEYASELKPMFIHP